MTKFYCKHCGHDTDGVSDYMCSARDGDLCEHVKRGKVKPKRVAVLKPKSRALKSALATVVGLAAHGKFDKYGEGTSLEKDDVAAVLKVCAAFGIEVPDSPDFPTKPKKRKKYRTKMK